MCSVLLDRSSDFSEQWFQFPFEPATWESSLSSHSPRFVVSEFLVLAPPYLSLLFSKVQ